MIYKYADKVTFVLHYPQIELAVEEGNDGKFPREPRRADMQEMPSRKWEDLGCYCHVCHFFQNSKFQK